MAKFKDRAFSNDEIEAWNTVLVTHEKTRKKQVVDIFHSGIKTLNIQAVTIPQLWEINEEVVKSTLGEMCEKLNNNKNLPFVQQTIPYSDLNLESVGA